MRHEHRFAGVALTALVAVACAGIPGGVTTNGPSVSAPATLQGTTWRLASIDGRPALSGVRVTANFESGEDRVAGSAGCNQYFGRAAVKGERLEVGDLGSTRMFCTADGVMAQESAYLSALGKASTYRVTGTQLRLGPTTGVVTLVFDAE